MKDKKTTAIVLSVGIGTFMSALDTSVVNLAIPLIQKHFSVTMAMVEWIVTAYLLVVSSLLLTFGRMADMYGQKKVYSTGFAIFILGSLLCGLSGHIAMLIGSRVLQALGAGMLFSTGPAIITNAVPPSRRGKALSTTAVAVALGMCTGPVVGGTLATLLGWQSIFFINVPIGIFGLAMIAKNLPKDEKTVAVPFDRVGSAMVFVALLLILLPLNLSGDYELPPAVFYTVIGAGLLLLVAFVMVERRLQHPMLKIDLFRNRVFAASNAAALFIFMAQFTMVFLVPFYLENLRGFTALHSGLLYLPMPLATMCVAPISGSMSDRLDSRYLSTCGALVVSCGLLLLSFLSVTTPTVYILVTMVIMGVGMGMFQTPNNSAIMGNVPPQNRGTASGTLATMRNIGMVAGVAVSGALFSYFEDRSPYMVVGKSGIQPEAFTYALHRTFLVAVAVALVAMLASYQKGRVKPDIAVQEKA